MHADRLSCVVCLPSLVLIVQAVFPFRVRTHRHINTESQTPVITPPTHCSVIAGMHVMRCNAILPTVLKKYLGGRSLISWVGEV